MFGSVIIHQVAPGTVIEHDGEKLEVTDAKMVVKGPHIYMTSRQYNALNEATFKGRDC